MEFHRSGWEHWGLLFKCAVIELAYLEGHGDGHTRGELGRCPITDRDERGGYREDVEAFLQFPCSGHEDIQKFSPSNLATAWTDLMGMSPGRAENHQELFTRTGEWQVRVHALGRDHGEELSDKMSIAAFVQVPPGDSRDVVCSRIDAQSPHRWIRDKIRNLVAHRACRGCAGRVLRGRR